MEKKYELTTETEVVRNKTLYRIRALKDFSDVSKGDLGGFIEKESNLSHAGDCWVGNDARVYGNAKVSGNAKVYDRAEVYGNARVYGTASVFDYAMVYNRAEVYGNASVYVHAEVSGNASVYDFAEVSGDVTVYDNTEILDFAKVSGYVRVHDRAKIKDRAKICSNDDDPARIYGSARIGGKFKVDGPVEISQGYNAETITIHSTLQWHKLKTLVSELDEEFN